MDFFARQESSRRTTRVLVWLFGLAFFGVAIATAIALTLIFAGFANQAPNLSTIQDGQGLDIDSLRVFAGIVVVTMALMTLASLFRAATLRRGGGQVARMLGGTQIQADDADPLHRRLINVSEEMAIASGLPVPEIYVLESEEGINAFAAGQTPADAAVAVTRGALERLNRDELQGVIAHEFSHVLNGDMRLNMKLMGFSFGILVLSILGRWLLRGSRFGYRSRNRGASAAILLGVALTVIGGLGVLFSRLIKAGVSRQREVLADASAVQFTRDPTGLAGALRKIGGFTTHLSSVETEEVSHMLFGRGTASFRGWFATHPPLNERILALDPSFRPGDYIASTPTSTFSDAGEADHHGGVSHLAEPGSRPTLNLDAAGSMQSPAVGHAVLTAIPADLRDAAHSTESSFLLMLALLVASDEQIAREQLGILEAQLGVPRTDLIRRLCTNLAGLRRDLWLPLVELALPKLKARPLPQLGYLLELAGKLSFADDSQALFRFALTRILYAYCRALGVDPAERGGKLPAVPEAVHTLLAAVAWHGHDDGDTARSAFEAGLATLTKKPKRNAHVWVEKAGSSDSFTEIERSLDRLYDLSPAARRKTLIAVKTVIEHDRKLTLEETELFRAIAAALDCPIPPLALTTMR